MSQRLLWPDSTSLDQIENQSSDKINKEFDNVDFTLNHFYHIMSVFFQALQKILSI